MWKLALFIAGTVALAIASRSSLLHPRSHGFTRFLAWEGILGLKAGRRMMPEGTPPSTSSRRPQSS